MTVRYSNGFHNNCSDNLLNIENVRECMECTTGISRKRYDTGVTTVEILLFERYGVYCVGGELKLAYL